VLLIVAPIPRDSCNADAFGHTNNNNDKNHAKSNHNARLGNTHMPRQLPTIYPFHEYSSRKLANQLSSVGVCI
jgi:hypothetical protein